MTVALAVGGLAPRVMELLKKPAAVTCLLLLAMLRTMYEHHPHPKVSKGSKRLTASCGKFSSGIFACGFAHAP